MALFAAAQAAEAAGAAASGGFFTQPETWVAVAFVIVAALLVRPMSRAIAHQLDARRDAIKNRLDEAERLHKEAQALLSDHQQRLRDAQRDATDMLASARADAERVRAEGERDLDDMLKRREQQALGRIAQAEADAVREVREVAVDLAMAAARRIIAEGMTPEKASALADKSIKDLGDKLH